MKYIEVYSDYESGANGFFTVTMGITDAIEQTEFNSVTIQSGNYLVFQGVGPMPATVIETWQRIWTYFATNSGYQRNFISDFEAYSVSDQVAIYIGVI